jgi:hypothetical protein
MISTNEVFVFMKYFVQAVNKYFLFYTVNCVIKPKIITCATQFTIFTIFDINIIHKKISKYIQTLHICGNFLTKKAEQKKSY